MTQHTKNSHKTSMLQDIEAGCRPEVDALVKFLAETMLSRADKKSVLCPQRSLNGCDKIRLRDDANQGLMAVDHRQVVVPLAVKHRD